MNCNCVSLNFQNCKTDHSAVLQMILQWHLPCETAAAGTRCPPLQLHTPINSALSDICSVCPIKASASCSGVVTGERERGRGERRGGRKGWWNPGPTCQREEPRYKRWDIKYNGCGKIGYKGKNLDDQNRIFFVEVEYRGRWVRIV